MRCPNCRAENRGDSKFCGDGGAPQGGGAGAGADFAIVTETLETPVRVLKTEAVLLDPER